MLVMLAEGIQTLDLDVSISDVLDAAFTELKKTKQKKTRRFMCER